MAEVKLKEDLLIEAKNFFDSYKREIGDSIRAGKNVVYVDFMKLSEFSSVLSDEIISNPEETLAGMGVAVEELGLIRNAIIRLFNLPDSLKLKIRDIRAKHLNELIVVEGIIRQASDVRPQVVKAEFECPSCSTKIPVLQVDKKFHEPQRCSCGRKGGFRLIQKYLVDTQRLVKEDLVEPKMEEKTTPGSRIRTIGVLKEVPVPLNTGGLSTRFELAIEINNIIPLEETFEELNISEEDEKEILELSKDPYLVEKLAGSITPGVWGYEEIKKSLVLQLFGGVKKIKADGQKKRGDIHILLIGDPGVAKSVTLTFMAEISPKGRYVVGKSASGAGLTATVVRDEYLRGWSLEAGAMVLQNNGLVCIDELEKMDANERSSMHEAMEQQTITISKASVQATLRAETSVLAAANPKFGRFDPTQSIPKQIDLPPTLINRFDVIFTLRDIPNKEKDTKIARHVLEEHKRGGREMIVSRDLFRKYIAYAKQKFKPVLTEEAIEEIEKFYVDLRNRQVSHDSLSGGMPPIPISARQLEALIRMSEASEKEAEGKLTKDEIGDAITELIKNSIIYEPRSGYFQRV